MQTQLPATLPKYLPLFDPDFFHDHSFFKKLEKIGYKTIMLGGTGGTKMKMALDAISKNTNLSIILHPSSPGEVFPTNLIILSAVMNSNSHYTRPFGSGSIAIARAIAEQNIPYLSTAYFIMGESTAHWYSDAFPIKSKKILLGYCLYSRMVGSEWLHLDYEGSLKNIEIELIHEIKSIFNSHLLITGNFTPQTALQALSNGAGTIITPSNIYEECSDPIELAREFYTTIKNHYDLCL